MLSILCVRLTIKVKVGIPESFKVGWCPPKKLGRVTLKLPYSCKRLYCQSFKSVACIASVNFKPFHAALCL